MLTRALPVFLFPAALLGLFLRQLPSILGHWLHPRRYRVVHLLTFENILVPDELLSLFGHNH